eukprot:CAMPEP_0180553774 /NCGR_PEP_ID=MMETSP1036_2-20121128/74578_1 /TAXON_ID=632150 /ORGANISM="Azadinium spinosum, Strain 3D9" /LENGTH=239 /DNA_ID=CAMNT_0022569557 /DNA_START=28 /DNA_END=743 /DNA_ORIENTATION=+
MTSSPKFEASTAKTSLLRGGLGVGLCAIGTDAISSRSSTSSEDAKTFTESTRCLMFRAAAAAASTGSELRASCMTAEMELNLFCCVLLPSWPPPMAAAAAATALKPLDRVLGPCEEATAALKLLGRSPSSNLGRAGLSLNSWGTAHVGGRSPLMPGLSSGFGLAGLSPALGVMRRPRSSSWGRTSSSSILIAKPSHISGRLAFGAEAFASGVRLSLRSSMTWPMPRLDWMTIGRNGLTG